MPNSLEALFRYTIISQVISRMHLGRCRSVAVAETAEVEHYFVFDQSHRRVSVRSVYRWLAAFEREGMKGLEPARRRSAPWVPPFSKRFVRFLIEQKRADTRASVPEIIRRAKQLGILTAETPIDRTTVYRACLRLGLPVTRIRERRHRDSRRFAYPHRMDMVLCDGKHFRAGATRQKRVALFFLDDATRYALHVIVGTSESAALFQRGLYEMLLRSGKMSILYLDRGPGFIDRGSLQAIENLRVLFIHGEKAYPEGHGKIERFNRTAKDEVLRGLDGRPDVDPEIGSLNVRLQHYIERVYNLRPHEALAGSTPAKRFFADPRPLRFPEDRRAIRRAFEVHLERRVSADHVVSVDSVAYEMPRGYRGQRVMLRKKLLDGGLFFLHEGRLVELRPVDVHANARSKRSRIDAPDQDRDDFVPISEPSAADLAFEADFGSVVDPDGGFDDTLEEDS